MTSKRCVLCEEIIKANNLTHDEDGDPFHAECLSNNELDKDEAMCEEIDNNA